jgi:hypothetical protein
MMAVVMIISLMLGLIGLSFANSRPSVRVTTDANNLVAFMRNMWDRVKATGSPLILEPDFAGEGGMSYSDPRTGTWKRAKFKSGARVLAIILNERVHTAETAYRYEQQALDEGLEDEEGNPLGNALYLSEARGLARVSILLGVPEDPDIPVEMTTEYSYLKLATLNLINGRGRIDDIELEDYQQLMQKAMDQIDEEEMNDAEAQSSF